MEYSITDCVLGTGISMKALGSTDAGARKIVAEAIL